MQISLAAARVNAELTQDEVSRIMHVSKTTIVNWEKGKIIPGIPQLAMMAEIYGLPVDNIFLKTNSTKSRVNADVIS